MFVYACVYIYMYIHVCIYIVEAVLYGITVLTSLMSWLCHLLVFRFIVVRCVPVIPHCMLLFSSCLACSLKVQGHALGRHV